MRPPDCGSRSFPRRCLEGDAALPQTVDTPLRLDASAGENAGKARCKEAASFWTFSGDPADFSSRQRRFRAHAAPLCPCGARRRLFPSLIFSCSKKRECVCGSIACSSIEKASKKAHRESASARPAFLTLARRSLAPKEQGDDARPKGAAAQPRPQVPSTGIRHGQGPLFPGTRAFFPGRGRCKAQGMRRRERSGGCAGFRRFWLRRDARPSHGQGAGALRCALVGAGAKDGFDGRVGEMTLPCPAGARGAAGVRIRRCSPLRGEGASELARLILVCRGERALAERSVLQELFGRRAGKRKTGRRYPHSRRVPAKNAKVGAAFAHPEPLLSGRSFPLPSRGENGGLCPHPLKGSIP